MSDKMSEVDWANDEAVVRGRYADARICVTVGPFNAPYYWIFNGQSAHENLIGQGKCAQAAWESARQHPTVAAFERENRPVSEVEVAKKAVLAIYPEAHAHRIENGLTGKRELWWIWCENIGCVGGRGESESAAWQDTASKLTPAAVAGDATRVTWRLDKISFGRPYSYNHCEENTARCAFDSISLGNAVTSVHLVKITTTEEIVESRNV